MKIHQIIISDTANGIGQRVSVFVSGCRHNCPGCHNKPGQDFSFGEDFDEEKQNQVLDQFRKVPVYDGITILGGDPTELENQLPVLHFLRKFKTEFPDKTVWMYTGELFEDIIPNGKHSTPELTCILCLVDVLVDGPFIQDLKDVRLNFRGSKNQRIIDVQQSLSQNKIIECTEFYNSAAD